MMNEELYSRKEVRASPIYFKEDLQELKQIDIRETIIHEPPQEYHIQKKPRDWGAKYVHKYWLDHKKKKKKIRKEDIEWIRQRAKKKVTSLEKILRMGKKDLPHRSQNQTINLKDHYPLLQIDIHVSQVNFTKLEKLFQKKMKSFSQGLAFAKIYQLKDKDPSLFSHMKKKYPYWKRSVKKFLENPEKFNLINRSQNRLILLIQKIYLFLENTKIEDSSMIDLYSKFKDNYPNETLSISKFRRIAKMIDFRYRRSKKSIKNSETEKIRRINFLSNLLLHIRSTKEDLFFFDCTSLTENNFKKKAWSLKLKPTGFIPKFYFQATHVLMLVSKTEVISFQAVKGNLSSLIIFNFMQANLTYLRRDNKDRKVKILMDNATMHRTMLMMNFFLTERVKILFIPLQNPYFNMIEFVFRYIKKDLRKEFSLK